MTVSAQQGALKLARQEQSADGYDRWRMSCVRCGFFRQVRTDCVGDRGRLEKLWNKVHAREHSGRMKKAHRKVSRRQRQGEK